MLTKCLAVFSMTGSLVRITPPPPVVIVLLPLKLIIPADPKVPVCLPL